MAVVVYFQQVALLERLEDGRMMRSTRPLGGSLRQVLVLALVLMLVQALLRVAHWADAVRASSIRERSACYGRFCQHSSPAR